MSNLRIPYNPGEWYFICATYNPAIQEEYSAEYLNNPHYWINNINPEMGESTNYTFDSGYGARCKVEVISRSDLLRARGYKV